VFWGAGRIARGPRRAYIDARYKAGRNPCAGIRHSRAPRSFATACARGVLCRTGERHPSARCRLISGEQRRESLQKAPAGSRSTPYESSACEPISMPTDRDEYSAAREIGALVPASYAGDVERPGHVLATVNSRRSARMLHWRNSGRAQCPENRTQLTTAALQRRAVEISAMRPTTTQRAIVRPGMGLR